MYLSSAVPQNLLFLPNVVEYDGTGSSSQVDHAYNTECLERYNTRVNRLENANVERRDWNDCLPTRGEAQKTYKYDIVMGSDLLYDVSEHLLS
jgi:hypothetical protein